MMGGILVLVIALMTAFVGPVLAGVFGLSVSNKLPTGSTEAAVVSGVINYVGFLLLAILTLLFAIAGMPGGGGGGGGVGNFLVPLIVAGIPSGIVGGLVTALGRKVTYPATREQAEAQEPPAHHPPRGGAQQP
jgi:hypothetical protein